VRAGSRFGFEDIGLTSSWYTVLVNAFCFFGRYSLYFLLF